MTKTELKRRVEQENRLCNLGFTLAEADQLRRISMTLHRWYELECGDSDDYQSWSIERDEETDLPYMARHPYNRPEPYKTQIPDREKGAKKRLEKIIAARNWKQTTDSLVSYYIQTDPRGAALYIMRPGDIPDGESAEGFYNRGLCVY